MMSLYRILPIISAAAWAVTLATLLIYWLARGRPQYPSQDEPKIAYVSDIGAAELKPFFIVGCFITGVTFSIVLLRIHHLGRKTGSRQWYDTGFRALAVVSGLASVLCLCLLSILDTQHWRAVHIPLLYIFCAGMLVSAACTACVEREHVAKKSMDGGVTAPGESPGRRWKSAIIVLIIVELILVIAFVALFSTWLLFPVGILEWIIAFLFTPYLWAIGLYLDSAEEALRKGVVRAAADERP